MRNNENRYEQIVGRIRESQPVLANPDKLTTAIMNKIESLPKQKTGYRLLQTTGMISGVAACLLICLFVKLALQQPDSILNNADYHNSQSPKISQESNLPDEAVFDRDFSILSASEKVEFIASLAGKKRAEMEKRRKIVKKRAK